MSTSDPTIIRNEDGSFTAEFPDPPRRTYEVTHEALEMVVAEFNGLVAERDQASADGWAEGEQWVMDHLWEYAVLRTYLVAEVRRLRAERDDLQAQTEALTHLNANLRDDLETADVGWRAQSDKRQVAETERDRLRTELAWSDAHIDGMEHVANRGYDAEAEVTRLRVTLRDILDRFTEHGYPGQPCLRTGWQYVEQVERWRALLDGSDRQEADDMSDRLPWEHLRADLPDPEQTREVIGRLEGEGKSAASLLDAPYRQEADDV